MEARRCAGDEDGDEAACGGGRDGDGVGNARAAGVLVSDTRAVGEDSRSRIDGGLGGVWGFALELWVGAGARVRGEGESDRGDSVCEGESGGDAEGSWCTAGALA